MRRTADLSKPFPFTYPFWMWPAIIPAFPLVWFATAALQVYMKAEGNRA